MTLRTHWDMEVFLAVMREGSMSGAAKRLGVDQSTVSRRLAALEDMAGCTFFARSKTGSVPTEMARRWLPAAEAVEVAMRQASMLAATAGTTPMGTVRVALPEAIAEFVVAPALPEFRVEHPGITLVLDTGHGLADVQRLEADLAVRFVRPERGDLLIRKIGATPVGVYVARSYATHHEIRSLGSLDWVSWDDSRAHLPERRWLDRVVGVRPVIMATRAPTILAAVRAGAGAGLFPERFAAQFPELVEVFPGALNTRFDVWLVRSRAVRDVPHVTLVAEWMSGLVESMPTKTVGV